MKFRKVLTSLTAVASIAALFSVAPTTASAANNSFKKPSSASIQKIEHAYVKNTPLTKQGYIIRIKDPVVKIMVGKENYERATKSAETFKCKIISPKKVQNVKFRIEKVFNLSNSSLLSCF